MTQYSYSINESKNEMTIWEGNCIMCTLSDIVDDENARDIFYDVVYEMRGIDLAEEYYVPSASNGDYSPSNPWDAPGCSIDMFIRGVYD
jgi:hypothetical protein